MVRCSVCGKEVFLPFLSAGPVGPNRKPGKADQGEGEPHGVALATKAEGTATEELGASPPVAPMPQADAVTESLLADLKGNWSDPAAHERFVDHCFRSGQLPFAAACYRTHLERNPEDEVAKAQQQRIVRLAESACLVTRSSASEEPPAGRWLLTALVAVLFLLVVGLLTAPLWRWW